VPPASGRRAMTGSPNDFDWSDDDSVVLRDQPAVAIYSNKFQQVVIRCERAWDQEDDVVVLVDFAHAIRVVHAILETAGHGDIEFIRPSRGGFVDVDQADDELPGPKDKTAAERQRRYRNKHRNGNGRDVTGEGVTMTNGHALPLLEHQELVG
jgi:hypothetical protein